MEKTCFHCSCGCSTFFGHQLVRMDVLVNGSSEFEDNVTKNSPTTDIYDSERPYGPFTCINCGKEYEELE